MPMESGVAPRTRNTWDHQPTAEPEDRKNTGGNGFDSIDRDAFGITHEFEAIAWYRQVAAQGNKHAQFLIGLAHMAGQGVPQNYDEAAEWFQKATDQGHPKAQQYLDCLFARKSDPGFARRAHLFRRRWKSQSS